MPVGLGGEQGWWCPTLDDSPDDISGNGNNGTYQGGMGTVADTSNGGSRAYDLDGTNDSISTTFGPGSWITTGVFSLSAWVKYDVLQDSTIAGGEITGNAKGVCLVFDTFNAARGHSSVYGKGGHPYAARAFSGDRDTVSVSQWYNVVATGDGTDSRIYVDGVLMNTTAILGYSVSPVWTNPFAIGFNGSFRLNGRIDDVRGYDRTLTQAEITHLATARGVLGGPGSDGYNAFTSAIYNPRNYNNTRFG